VFVFRGSGFGHGLGLCQLGAHELAGRGWNHTAILSFYFPQTHVEFRASALNPESSSAARVASNETSDKFSLAALTLAGFGFNPDRVMRPVGSRLWQRRAKPVLSGEHFQVTYPPELNRGQVEAIMRQLEVARSNLSRRIEAAGLPLRQAKVEVVLHSSTQEFVEATGQPWYAAGATRGNRVQLQPVALLRRKRILESTLRHECAHAILYQLGGESCPRWLVEGLSIHFAQEAAMFRKAAPRKRLSLDELEGRLGQPASSNEMRELYAAAYEEVARMIETEGEAALLRKVAGCGGSVLRRL
jgi:hypothetical protein